MNHKVNIMTNLPASMAVAGSGGTGAPAGAGLFLTSSKYFSNSSLFFT